MSKFMGIIFLLSMVLGCSFLYGTENQGEDGLKEIIISGDLKLKPLVPGLWIHISYKDMDDYGRVPANGLLVVDGTSAALVDLPWTNEQTDLLFDWVTRTMGAHIETVIPTHSHQDCTGGLTVAHKRGAKSYSFEKTAAFARERGEPVPQHTFGKSLELTCGSIQLMAAYLGGGHTVDNIVVWLPCQQILFGGCMIKAAEANSLGYTKEADIDHWPTTLKAVKEKYSAAKIIIPGHGAYGGMDLIDHTLDLLERQKEKK